MRRSLSWTHPRSIRFSTNIACQVVRLRDFRLVADRVFDISCDGMLVGPAEPVLTGESILVSFRVPDWGRWVDAEAVVARVVHGRRPGEQMRALGLVVHSMPEPARFCLTQAMRWMPPAPFRRRLGRRSDHGALRRLIRNSGRRYSPLAIRDFA